MTIVQSDLSTVMKSSLAQHHKPLAKALDDLLKESRELGATEGSQRLELICDQYNQLSPNTTYLWIDPGAFQYEIEEAQTHTFRMECVHFMRNLFSLLPLIATWASLFIAVSSYQQYLLSHRSDQPTPFLQLWQSGFDGITNITFTLAAGTDVVLLLFYLLFVLLTYNMERRAHLKAVNFVRKLQIKIEEMMKYVVSDTVHIGDQSDIERVINGVKQVVDSATTAMTQIVDKMADGNKQAMGNLEQAVNLIVADAQRSIKQTTDSSTKAIIDSNSKVEELFKNQIMPMMTSFNADMGTLHKELGSYQGRLNDLTNASQQLATAGQELAHASSTLVDNAERYVTIGQDISTQIASLNVTQNDVLLQIEAVASGITTAAGNMTTATTNMEAAAITVAGVAKQLDSGMRTTIETMTRNVHDSTRALAQVGPQLYQTSTYLYYAAQALASAQPKPPGILRRLTRNLKRQPQPPGAQNL